MSGCLNIMSKWLDLFKQYNFFVKSKPPFVLVHEGGVRDLITEHILLYEAHINIPPLWD